MTPKEIAQKRLARSKLMKIELHERNRLVNKENENPILPPIRKCCYKVHDKDARDFGIRNPFFIPNQQRIFSKGNATRKIKPEPFIMSEPHTICDIDGSFFKIIEGRPLRQFDDIKVYMRNIRDITLFKANAAYLKDQIIQLDTSLAFELVEYKAIDKLFNKCKDSFVQFAKESYSQAKAIQAKATDKAAQLDAVTDQLESLSFNYVALRNKLAVINIHFETLSIYRQFIYSISPISWREENDKNYPPKKVVIKPPVESPKQSGESLYRFVLRTDEEPKLFFKKPSQISLIFNNLSRQCLTYMEIEGVTSSIVSSVLKSRDVLKAQTINEIHELEEFVETYKEHVKFMEVKEQEFKEKFEKILLNEFQDLYASYDVSKLFTCLQYTNTRVFEGPEDPKDNITTLMLQLEKEYIELTSGLDNLNQEVVKEATNEFFSQDLKMMHLAHLAQRNLKECDILSKALYTSFEAPRRKYKM